LRKAEADGRRQILSTKMPALIALATDRNFVLANPSSVVGFLAPDGRRVNVDVSHARTSGGTASGSTSENSSSSSVACFILD
jgi:hypothetical protein